MSYSFPYTGVSLGRFIPRYLILFVAMVNGIDSLISLSDFSFLFFSFFLKQVLNFIFKLYNIVLVLPNIEMNPPQVYPRSPS